jgi:hypothetical protein
MLISRSVAPPAGTFLARVRDGGIQFPPPLKAFCDAEGWNLFRLVPGDPDHLSLEPILASDSETPGTEPGLMDDFCSSLTDDGRLWIPAKLRDDVSLVEQFVMVRVENGGIGVYLRKVFDTLGFRP